MSAAVSARAERVYAAIAAHAWDEAVAWPSQKRIAEHAGLCRQSVNGAVRELREAGWLEVEKRRHEGSPWDHCVYSLLAGVAVSWATIRRRTREAHRKATVRARAIVARVRETRSGYLGDTNRTRGAYGDAGTTFCRCWACRPARGSDDSPPGSRSELDRLEDRRRDRLGPDAYRAALIAEARRVSAGAVA